MSGEKREYYAETVEKALDKAVVDLSATREELTYSVVDEGSSGFLGIGARDARISVDVPEISLDHASEQDDTLVTVAEQDEGAIQDLAPDEQAYSSEEPESPAEPDIEFREDEGQAVTEEVPDEVIIEVDGFATELLEKMGFDATVDAFDDGEVIRVDVTTKETGLLIGQKGETIDAIQYLLNVIVYKNKPFLKRIVVDTEGYRQRRVEALQGMAHRTARRAQREKRRLDLPPMAAAERRVVHLFLKGNPDVSTVSEGSEDDRRVVIIPNE